MLRKFAEGLVFGAGFAISVAVIGWLGSILFFHPTVPEREWRNVSTPESDFPTSAKVEEGPEFHELGIEDKIEKSSVIALTRFEPSPDGRMKAVFKEFLKKDPETKFHYKIGDEYPSGSYFPGTDADRGEGLVVFFVGSPAEMRLSMSYSGDRIRSLGDIPIELFRDKCKDVLGGPK